MSKDKHSQGSRRDDKWGEGSGGSDRRRMSSGGVFGLISGAEVLQWPVSVSVEWREQQMSDCNNGCLCGNLMPAFKCRKIPNKVRLSLAISDVRLSATLATLAAND